MFDRFKEKMEEEEKKREKRREKRENREEMGVTEGVVDTEKEYLSGGYKKRLGELDNPYIPEDEGRERRFEYKTQLMHAHMGGVLNRFDALLNEDSKDGWRLVRFIDSQDLGEGIKPGLIAIYERPVENE